jgi:predicted NUDIX family NTP pyrophosphohydrolase
VESDDLLACAKREFLEETNLRPKGDFIPLRPVRQKSGKTVHAFAVETDLDLSCSRSNAYSQEWPPGSGKFKSFPEIDRIAYFDLATARIKILPYQLPFLDELSAMLA